MKAPANSNQFRPTVATVDLQALRENFALARECVGPKVGLLAVVKANAYGHGAVPVATELEAAGAVALAVATPHEGDELRRGGIKAPILLLGGPFGAPGEWLRERQLTPVLFHEAQIRALQTGLKGKLSVQLKVDTGMTRLGVLPRELPAMLKALAQCPHLELSGVLSHLAQADTTFDGPTAEQFRCFAEVEAIVRREAPGTPVYHLANSAAILGKKVLPGMWARPGIMLYGANPHPRLKAGDRLKPVMHFHSAILSLKEVPKGTAVSYGGDWVAPRTSRIAVIPAGYADGYVRHLSGRGQVLIRGDRFPIVGRVCMDLSMVDVTDLDAPRLEEPVTLWGPGLSVTQVAEWAGTISYELLCAVSARVPRVYAGGSA